MPAIAIAAADEQTAVSVIGGGERDDQNHSVFPLWFSIETWQDY